MIPRWIRAPGTDVARPPIPGPAPTWAAPADTPSPPGAVEDRTLASVSAVDQPDPGSH